MSDSKSSINFINYEKNVDKILQFYVVVKLGINKIY